MLFKGLGSFVLLFPKLINVFYLLFIGYARHGTIAVTQPRRMAAISVAERVAEELGCPVGGLVGYQVRFEECISEVWVRIQLSLEMCGYLLSSAPCLPFCVAPECANQECAIPAVSTRLPPLVCTPRAGRPARLITLKLCFPENKP